MPVFRGYFFSRGSFLGFLPKAEPPSLSGKSPLRDLKKLILQTSRFRKLLNEWNMSFKANDLTEL